MIGTGIKEKIVKAIVADRHNYSSDRSQSTALGVAPGVLSQVKQGRLEKVLSDGKWLAIARRLGVQLREERVWHTAKTPVYNFVTSQLSSCQSNGLSALLCDSADIGKSYTARVYVRSHRNAIYVDCSQVKFKQQLIRKIAQEFGVENRGRYTDVYEDLVYYLQSTEVPPLIVLDEAGDLNYPAFLELKALWNATEGHCGWYMMGANGLRAKIERNVSCQKVGYAEIFSRFGKRFQKVTPDGAEAQREFAFQQVALLGKANNTKRDLKELYAATDGSLRRVGIELKKEYSGR